MRILAPRYAWRWLWPLAVALVVRMARGYRGFPAIDDYAYVPLARAALDPSLYTGDRFLHGFLLHSPIWTLVVGAADRTIGLANGLWLATMVLTIATVFAAFRLLRTAGVPAYVLPLFVALGFIGQVQGIGRGAYDGALGNGFHAQWVAICLLLWCYVAFARHRPVATGVLLGLTTLAHPLVGVHGAIALAIATIVVRGAAWKELGVIALACSIVSAPITLPVLLHLGREGATSWATADVVRQGYLFRAPHHYTLTEVSAPTLLAVGLLAISGLAAVTVLDVRRRPIARKRLAGLCTGQVALLCAALALNGPLRETTFALVSLTPYQLDLTRTTPLALVLSVLLVIAALWDAPRRLATPATRALWLCLGIALMTLAMLAVAWHLALIALVAGAIGLRVLRVRYREPGMVGALAVIAVVGGAWSALRDRREAPLPPAQETLYEWARDSTAADALFIVPPGFRGFRLLAQRPIYADFEMFPLTSPAEMMEWRRRLELVAEPDSFAAQQRGWAPGMTMWDRSYAVRNTPSRIASLLDTTGARYFVWDSLAAEVPPYVPTARPASPDVRVAYSNARFKVYERATDAAAR